MDKPLHIIEPYKHGMDGWLILTFGFFALSIAVMYYYNKNKKLDYNRRNIIVMLSGFIAAIAFMSGGFRLYSKWRLQPIEVSVNHIKTPYGKAPLNNLLDYYIKLEKRYKPMQADIIQDSAYYFFLIERNNKTHVLSEGDYPIREVLDKLNEVMGYEKKEK